MIWTRTYSKFYQDIKSEDIWRVWTDINNWHLWNRDIEYCKMDQPFAVGNWFILKPKGAPAVQIQLVEVEENKKYTDYTKFFGAKMYGIHSMAKESGGIKLTTTIQVTGIFKYLWIKLVAENIVKGLEEKTDNLVSIVRENSETLL